MPLNTRQPFVDTVFDFFIAFLLFGLLFLPFIMLSMGIILVFYYHQLSGIVFILLVIIPFLFLLCFGIKRILTHIKRYSSKYIYDEELYSSFTYRPKDDTIPRAPPSSPV